MFFVPPLRESIVIASVSVFDCLSVCQQPWVHSFHVIFECVTVDTNKNSSWFNLGENQVKVKFTPHVKIC